MADKNSFGDTFMERWRSMVMKEDFWEEENNRIAKIKTGDLRKHDHISDNPMHPLMQQDPNNTYMADQVRERLLNAECDCDYYKDIIERERTGSNEEIEEYRRDLEEELENLARPRSIFREIQQTRDDFLHKLKAIKSDDETIMQIEIAKAKSEIVKIRKEHDKVMDAKEAEAKKSRKEMEEKNSQLKEMQVKVYQLEAENQRLKKQIDEKEKSLKSKDEIIMLNVQMMDSQRVEIVNLKKVDESKSSRSLDKVPAKVEKEESFSSITIDDVPINQKRKLDQMSRDSSPSVIDLVSDEDANSSIEDYYTPEPKQGRGRPRKTISPKLSKIKIKIKKGNMKSRTKKTHAKRSPVSSTSRIKILQ